MKKLAKLMSVILIMAVVLFCTTTVQAASSSKKKLAVPKNVKVSISGTSNVKVKWTKTSKAKKYTIYRATTKSGKYKKIGTTKSTSYTDKKATRGKTYYYKVVANASKAKLNSKRSAAKKITVPSKAKALKEIKKSLKNQKWVNKNLKMKKNCFGEKINSKAKQTLTFSKIKGKELVLVQTECYEELSVQGYLVGYYNGKVTVKALSKYPMHDGHSGIVVVPNKGIVATVYMHQGYEGGTFYKVSDVKFSKKADFIDNEGSGESRVMYQLNGKKTNKTKYYKELSKYVNYNYEAVTTKLTSKNIDKYVK